MHIKSHTHTKSSMAFLKQSETFRLFEKSVKPDVILNQPIFGEFSRSLFKNFVLINKSKTVFWMKFGIIIS